MMLSGQTCTLCAARMQGSGRLAPLQPAVHAYSVAATPAIMPHAACGIRPSRPVLRTLVIAAAASSCLEGQQPAVESYGGLAKYLAGLTAEEQMDVFKKLEAEGYAVPGREDTVDSLTDATLEKFGIQPGAVRSLLLKAFALCGPGKTVVLVDEDGNEEEVEFANKREFERWALTDTLKLPLETGRKRYIKTWEQLQDGGTYITTKSLEKKVVEVQGFINNIVTGQENSAQSSALEQIGGEAGAMRFCFKKLSKGAVAVELDGAAYSDKTVVVVECKQQFRHKDVVDFAEKLEDLSTLIKRKAPNTDVLRGPDGQPKLVRAYLQAGEWGSDPEENAAIRSTAEEKGITLYEVNGPGLNTTSGCNPPRPDDKKQAAKVFFSRGARKPVI